MNQRGTILMRGQRDSRRYDVKPINRITQGKHFSTRISGWGGIEPATCVENYAPCELMQLKNNLNVIKSQQDGVYESGKRNPAIARKWQTMSETLDVYRGLRWGVSEAFGAEHVSNAWLKAYELIVEHNLVPNGIVDHSFRAAFNAELPGSFICAFNHYMKTVRKGQSFEWVASSYWLPGSAALGDQYGLYEKYPANWIMSDKDGQRGDMTVVDDVMHFAESVGDKVDFYSHDAGLDSSDDFNNQEIMNAKLHLGCALAGIMVLKPGGSFVAKQYTCFETLTWNLITVYASLFDEFYLCKPLTSRAGNSETYLVGKGFKGISSEMLAILLNKFANFDMSPIVLENTYKLHLHQQFSEIHRFARVVFHQQGEVLKENMTMYVTYADNVQLLRQGLVAVKKQKHAEWQKKYQVMMINQADRLTEPSRPK